MKLNLQQTVLLSLLVGIFTPSGEAEAQEQFSPSDIPSRIDYDTDTPTPPPSEVEIPIPSSPNLIPPMGAEDQIFVLKSLNLEGVTAYSVADIEYLYGTLIDQEISLAQVYAIANELNQKYRNDGYILSQVIIPQQRIQDGVVTIQAIEGYIDTVEFEGLSPDQEARLHGFGEKIKASYPLNNADLERYLLLANDLAGFTVRGVLGEGQNFGAGKLTFVAEHDPVDGYVNFNNRGTDAVGELRFQSAVIVNSPLAQGERLTLSTSIAPNDFSELNSGDISLNLPVGYEGLEVNLSGGVTAIRPGENLEPFDINGNTTTFTASVEYPVMRSRDQNLAVKAEFDYLDEEITTNFTGTETYLSEDRLRVFRVSANTDLKDEMGITYGNAELSVGVDGLGAKSESTASRPLSRPNGSPSFTKLNLEVGRYQQLGNGFGLNVEGKAQIASTSLLASEQFGLGGTQFGRAFDSSEILGDSGYGVRAELQKSFFYAMSPNTIGVTQPYAFIDYGQVYRRSATATEPGQSALGSTGLGVRQSLTEGIDLELELAFPIVEDNLIEDVGTRVFFGVKGFF